MSFEPSNPTSGFTSPSGWEPHDDAQAIGDILRNVGVSAPPPPPDPTGLRAFPGAVGYGATACIDADRSNTHVFTVTSTNQTGAGSFHQAVLDAEAEDPDHLKVIVFRTGGYFNASTLDGNGRAPFSIEGKNIIIACQTAPGDGMALGGPTAGNSRFAINGGASDIIVRYLRVRHGLNASLSRRSSCMYFGTPDAEGTGLLIERVYIDHPSLSWSQGITIVQASSQWDGIEHYTFDHPIIAESREEHPSGCSLDGAEFGTQIYNNQHSTWIGHWMHSNRQRNISSRGLQLSEQINCLWSNCRWSVWGGDASITDYINCYHQYGPYKSGSDGLLPPYLILAHRIADGTFPLGPSYHIVGTISAGGDGRAAQLLDPDADNWDNNAVSNTEPSAQGLVDFHPGTGDLSGTGLTLLDFKRNERFFDPGADFGGRDVPTIYGPPDFPATPLSATAGRTKILSDEFGGGACMAIDSQGRWFKRMDPVDARYRTEVANETGVSTDKVVTSGDYPFLDPGTAPTDSNGDGIPDDYYLHRSEDPSGPSLASQIDENGYTFVENWLNGVDHETSALRTAF